MKKMKMIFAAGIIVMLAACNKEAGPDKPVVATKGENLALLNVTATDPAANTSNPYDSIGVLHNVVLDALRQYVKNTGDTTRTGKAKYLAGYFRKYYGKDVKPFYNPNEKLGCTDYKAIMLQQKVSPSAQTFFRELSKALESIKDLDHYDDYKEQIVMAEKNILAAKLPENERINLLMTASVLRYSGYYWMGAFKNGIVVLHNSSQMVSTDSLLRKIAGVIAGIGADASMIAYCYFTARIDILDMTATWSEVCGYYTGWW